MCDYKGIFGEDNKCPHPDYGPGKDGEKNFCIFHNDREDKDAEKFYQEFKKLYKSGKHYFRGFIFPESFDFRKLKEETGDLEFKEASFGGTKFSGVAYFAGATFSEETDFSKSTFSEETNFSVATFSGEADFEEATFSGKTDFGYAAFSERVSFGWASFLKTCKVIFKGKTFDDNSEVYFGNLNIEKEADLIFYRVDLNRLRFIKTDLRKINFVDVTWTGKKYGSSSYLGRLKLFDEKYQGKGWFIQSFQHLWYHFKFWLFILKEKVIKQKKENQSKAIFRNTYFKILTWLKISIPKEIEQEHYEVYRLYNQLIKNYEDTNRYHEAGDFFVGAMEMRRFGRFEKRSIRMLLGPYKWISLYGERPIRALCWLVGLILLLGLIYGNLIGVLPKNNTLRQVYQKGGIETIVDKYTGKGSYDNYVNGLNMSLNYLTFGKVETPHELRYTRYGFLLQAAEVVFGAVFLSLFILAMNRKFRRMKD
ncbi:MAG: pentapeptide repeat-containing protein [Deltaproteobacteria bacterium]|uniref:Pentapeptide repeat-containing protein n=1 Tax=Candidatus Zymogenus saltonus TaxID=2844893 RepID=A0A9D8KDJ2_9DELT|nr:pentapeptide repeat-containing protein [Candidatus Zymogenus saltonus]